MEGLMSLQDGNGLASVPLSLIHISSYSLRDPLSHGPPTVGIHELEEGAIRHPREVGQLEQNFEKCHQLIHIQTGSCWIMEERGLGNLLYETLDPPENVGNWAGGLGVCPMSNSGGWGELTGR